MSRIDPARFSRILASLASPKGKASASIQVESSEQLSKKARKDISVLRTSLKKRLSKLRISSDDFDSAAPVVLVQEILYWEFGSEIVEHAAFEKATRAISDALLSSPQTQTSLVRLLSTLTEDSGA